MVFVTISGCVGSGKSTAVRHVVRMLEREGIRATRWGFRALPCFAFMGSTETDASRPLQSPAGPTTRRVDYRRKRLTAWFTLGYIARIVAFQLFRWRRHSSHEWIVLNRYFYDSFVHYTLGRRVERVFAAILRRLVPRPDVAVVLVAAPDVIAARRPKYSTEYIMAVVDEYERLSAMFPNLIEIRTDQDQPVSTTLEAVLGSAIARSGIPLRGAK